MLNCDASNRISTMLPFSLNKINRDSFTSFHGWSIKYEVRVHPVPDHERLFVVPYGFGLYTMTESKMTRFTFQTHHPGSCMKDRSSYTCTAKTAHTEITIITVIIIECNEGDTG